MRTEHDFLGTMEIDDAAYYGIQTMRGCGMSDVTGHTLGSDGLELIYAIAQIKKAAALANQEIGGLDPERAQAIIKASEEIQEGRFDDQFPVDMITGGGGISVHMNVNEVIAHRATELLKGEEVHPNTHVNMGQSTNDVLPSAMLLASYRKLIRLIACTKEIAEITEQKAVELKDVVKLGRTCLQDAVPVTFGQDIMAWADFMKRQQHCLEQVAEEFLTLTIGGAAVGTGAGSLPGYDETIYKYLRTVTGLPVVQSGNLFDSMQHDDVYMRASGALKSLSAGLSKIASDLRILSSGPKAGFGELTIPAVLPGSSIMPGKMNPVLPELMIQIHFIVFGNDAAITMAVERSELELNVWEAVITKCFFESCRMLEHGLPLFAKHCIAGIQVNTEHCLEEAEKSTATASVISSVFGYETGSRVAREAIASGKKVKEVVVDMGLLDAQTAEQLLNPLNMTDAKRLAEVIAQAKKTLLCK